MTKEELLHHCSEAIKTEEAACTIYLRHLAAIVQRSGLPQQDVQKIKEEMEYLIEANKRHKRIVESVMEQIKREGADVY